MSKKMQGFALMSVEQRRAIASLGGRTAVALGVGHRFTSAEAREAGKLGACRDPERMRQLGRLGAAARKLSLAARRAAQ